MEDKKVSSTEFFMSLKRIEFLLEELIYQSCIIRMAENPETVDEKFKIALKNVSDRIEGFVQGLPPAQES